MKWNIQKWLMKRRERREALNTMKIANNNIVYKPVPKYSIINDNVYEREINESQIIIIIENVIQYYVDWANYYYDVVLMINTNIIV